MNKIRVRTCMSQDVTVLSNDFLDRFLPKANGDFIKIYLYFLRSASAPDAALSLCSAADRLNCTENDILRALRYWEKEQVLNLALTENGELREISFVSFCSKEYFGEEKQEVTAPSGITADRMTELAQQEDIRELMFIAQQYLGKTLTSTEARTLCFFYDGLHFSPDLIDFLIEYCVSRGHKSFRYMEKVAMNWHEQGISTVHAARTQIESYHREYYDILKALGSDGRHPVEAEIKMMKKWLETWELPMPVILEACERTVLKTQKPTLRYADGILSRWQAEGVKSVDDVRRLDAEYIREKEQAGKKAAPAVRKKTGSFSEFGQRSYDYDSLESKLLNQ